MKKIIYIIAAIILILSTHLTMAQEPPIHTEGNWEWAHFYYGQDGQFKKPVNYITNSHLDEEGNIYIFGSYGNKAIFDGNENDSITDCPTTDHPHNGDAGIFLAKYNQEGNRLWKKLVKGNQYARPIWMEVTDSLIYILGEYSMLEFSGNDGWVYFLDTMIYQRDLPNIPREEQKYPFKIGDVGFFSKLDLDGNLIESAFIGRNNNPNHPESIYFISLYAGTSDSPFKVDNEGNIYQLVTMFYSTNIESNIFNIYIETADTTYLDTIIMPISEYNPYLVTRDYLFKFSPDWEILWHKPIVQNLDGFIPMRDPLDTSVFDVALTYRYTGMDIDENANIYLTGEINPMNVNASQAGHNFPCHIYFDSNVYITMEREEEVPYFPFLVKFDSTGTPQWCQQVHRQNGPNEHSRYASTAFKGVDVNGDAVYVPFYIRISGDQSVTISDDYTITNIYGSPNRSMGSFLSYNKETGEFLHHGYGPNTRPTNGCFQQNFVHENHLFLMGQDYRTEIYHFTTDGQYIEMIPFYTDFPSHGGPNKVSINNQGDLFAIGSIFNRNGSITPPVPIGDFNLACSPTLSNAVYALYHNDAYAHPHVMQQQSIVWDQNLTFNINEHSIPLTATATSGLPVSYTCSDTTIARIEQGNIVLLQNGMAIVTAHQDGNPYYYPATPYSKPLLIANFNDIDSPSNGAIAIYPNPATHNITIQLPPTDPILRSAEIYNSTGDWIETHTTNAFSIAHLPSGVYMIKVITNDGVYTQKVIKK